MRCAQIMFLLAAMGCEALDEGPAPRPSRTRRVTVEGFSASFEVPNGFIESSFESGIVLAGPEGTAEFYTPLIVQPRATRATLSAVLNGLVEPLLENPSFQLHRQAPIATGGVIALLYELSFELHDARRRRLGILVPTPGGVVDIALATNEELFVEALPVFDWALDSLVVTERESRD